VRETSLQRTLRAGAAPAFSPAVRQLPARAGSSWCGQVPLLPIPELGSRAAGQLGCVGKQPLDGAKAVGELLLRAGHAVSLRYACLIGSSSLQRSRSWRKLSVESSKSSLPSAGVEAGWSWQSCW